MGEDREAHLRPASRKDDVPKLQQWLPHVSSTTNKPEHTKIVTMVPTAAWLDAIGTSVDTPRIRRPWKHGRSPTIRP